MKPVTKISLVLGGVLLAALAGLMPGFRPPAEVTLMAQATPPHVVAFDTAVDCRTYVTGPNRGDVFIVNGKLFPAGTLPSGAASFDPAKPVNGVAPIGEWMIRGQHNLPFPPALAPLYSSAPFDLVTGYFIFDGGQSALISEAYNFLPSGQYFAAVTGGIGRFRGAAGDFQGAPMGTNGTGCPNFTTRIYLVPGSVRGASNN